MFFGAVHRLQKLIRLESSHSSAKAGCRGVSPPTRRQYWRSLLPHMQRRQEHAQGHCSSMDESPYSKEGQNKNANLEATMSLNCPPRQQLIVETSEGLLGVGAMTSDQIVNDARYARDTQ